MVRINLRKEVKHCLFLHCHPPGQDLCEVVSETNKQKQKWPKPIKFQFWKGVHEMGLGTAQGFHI